jgi:hypothetical protein
MVLIQKSDLSTELQITFDAGYTDAFFLELCAWAEDILKLKTHRTAFTGSAASAAKNAALSLAIDRLATSNRNIIASSISSISENGASISFNSGKTLESYRNDFNLMIGDLKLPGTSNYNITFPDLDGTHTGLENSILY